MERDLSQEAAERLLSGDLMPPPYGTERLAALLAAASAPGRPDELAGEAAAMAAFRAPPLTVRRWSLRRALTVKVAAVVAVTVAAGGVAVASSTGLLPIPFIPGNIGPVPSDTDGPSGHPPGQGRTSNPAHMPASPAVIDLCVQYQKKSSEEKPKELKGRPFEELVKAAGGAENVDAYCTAVLSATPAPSKGKDNENQGNGMPGNGVPGLPGNGTQGENEQGIGQPKPLPTPSAAAAHSKVTPTG